MTTRGMTPPAPLRNVLKTPGTRESTLMAEGRNYSTLDRDSLRMHAAGRPGKIEVVPTKPLTTQYHLALAYSRSEEHTSALQSLMRISYAVFCLTTTQVTT